MVSSIWNSDGLSGKEWKIRSIKNNSKFSVRSSIICSKILLKLLRIVDNWNDAIVINSIRKQHAWNKCLKIVDIKMVCTVKGMDGISYREKWIWTRPWASTHLTRKLLAHCACACTQFVGWPQLAPAGPSLYSSCVFHVEEDQPSYWR